MQALLNREFAKEESRSMISRVQKPQTMEETINMHLMFPNIKNS